MIIKLGIRSRRIILWFAMCVAILLTLCLGYVNFQILNPSTGPVHHSNAVISLAPGQNRMPTSLQLLEEGVAHDLYISWSGNPAPEGSTVLPEFQLETDICSDHSVQNVSCFVPKPISTLGEALTMRTIASEKQWKSVTVVTSSYHVFRTSYIFSRCLPGVKVQVVAAPTDLSPGEWLFRVAYENASLVKAFIQVPAACS